MVKAALYFIPPLGHHSLLYEELTQRLAHVRGLAVTLLDYPTLGEEGGGDLLDGLARHFLARMTEKGNIFVGGVSLGGTLAFRIAQLGGERVAGTLTMAPGGLKVSDRRRRFLLHSMERLGEGAFLRRAVGLEDEGEFMKNFSANQQGARRYLETLRTNWPVEADPAKVGQFARLARAAFTVDYERVIAAVAEGALTLWPEKDRIFSSRHLERFRELMPRASIEVVEGAGHFLPLEYPVETAERIIRHVEKRVSHL